MITELLNAFLITFFVTTFELHPLCQLTRRAYDNTRINGSCCCESTAAEYNLQQLRIQISLNFWKRSRVHVFVNQSRCLYKREHRGFYLSRVDTWSFFFFMYPIEHSGIHKNQHWMWWPAAAALENISSLKLKSHELRKLTVRVRALFNSIIVLNY